MQPRITLFISIIVLSVFVVCSCNQSNHKLNKESEKDVVGIYEDQIRRMEKLIPNALFDTNHVAIWRSGSNFYSEKLSLLVIEKKHLKDNQLRCYYITFNSDKPSNYSNWKFCNVYEVTLENTPFKFPLVHKIRIEELDTLSYTIGEGIESNNYFIADFKSDSIYPVSKRYNSKFIGQVAKLFSQISKREKVQTFVLTEDSVIYEDAFRIINGSDEHFIIKE